MYKAQALHACLIKQGLHSHAYRCNLLLQSYVKSNSLSDAQKLLSTMPVANAVSYNTVLSGYFSSGSVAEALNLFESTHGKDCQSWNIVISGLAKYNWHERALTHFLKMRDSVVRPDAVTYSIVVPCCELGLGKQVHGEIVKMGVGSDAFLGTNLMKMYGGAGAVHSARKVFGEMPERDLVAWNAMIFCFSKHGGGDTCVELFRKLCREGIQPDEYTYAIILNDFVSHAQLFEAMMVQSAVTRRGYHSDCFINNALIDLYFKCGFVASAFKLFEEMANPDLASWTTMIVGFSQSGHMELAESLFHEMRIQDIKPNSFTFGGLLSGCATSNALQWGKQLHALVLKCGLENEVIVGSSLLDVYSKCSEMDNALKAFRGLSEKDIVSWNGIICGYAANGQAEEALKLYNEMLREGSPGVSPNVVTFVGVLSACCHAGLVEEGCHHFIDMVTKHCIRPTVEHYTCIVDLLGRAGHLEEAEALLLSLPSEPDVVIWGALLGACKLHGNLRMARHVSKHLHANEPFSSSNYVLLANSYTDSGRWGEAVEVRELMQARGVQKNVGCSWIDVRGCMRLFLSGDKSHPLIDTVREVLKRLHLHIDEVLTIS
ncbi:pentatricopeptide repeat-containing protein At2g13600 [Eucalyptus grandis]|uniref:pentatricopeptide repeat-containing protein At2g13600 n=1 Tax=Eucalyptus grandis TaxID=71139 RepID=UPI00192E7E69|nr:pentatricopeptide repeat-containing protein At2g13600 [Eucalyptus grandis]